MYRIGHFSATNEKKENTAKVESGFMEIISQETRLKSRIAYCNSTVIGWSPFCQGGSRESKSEAKSQVQNTYLQEFPRGGVPFASHLCTICVRPAGLVGAFHSSHVRGRHHNWDLWLLPGGGDQERGGGCKDGPPVHGLQWTSGQPEEDIFFAAKPKAVWPRNLCQNWIRFSHPRQLCHTPGYKIPRWPTMEISDSW